MAEAGRMASGEGTMAAATSTFAQLKNFCDTFYLIFMTHTRTHTHRESQATPHIVIYRPQVVAESFVRAANYSRTLCGLCPDRQTQRQTDAQLDRQTAEHT